MDIYNLDTSFLQKIVGSEIKIFRLEKVEYQHGITYRCVTDFGEVSVRDYADLESQVKMLRWAKNV